ncbi:MAG: membrane protein insertase YidC [Acidobacteria bacterium]|nr:membrane protein insertase YidC [Acidobacteriota bacterium]
MQRRVLLAFFLSFVVLYAYQALFVPTPTNRGAPGGLPAAGDVARPAPASELPATAGAAVEPGAMANLTPPPAAPAVEDAVPEGPPVVAAAAAESIVVESDALRAVFTNRGAVLVSWELRNYLDEVNGEPVDLVPRELPAEEPAPFSVAFSDPALTARAAAGLYRASTSALRITDRDQTLAFEFEDAGGLRVRKAFRFEPAANPFVVTVSVEASLAGQPLVPIIRWGPALGGVESSSSGLAYRVGPRGVMYGRVQQDGTLSAEEVERPDASDVTARPTYEGLLRFVGVDNHYFLAAALPGNAETVVTYRAVPLPPRELDGDARELMAFDLALPGSAPDVDLPFFIGPKDFEILEAAHPALVRSLDFGWFAWLVVPLHRSLTWVHGYVGNWGWAIILLTVLINLVILPLRHKSVVSMRKMQELQPEMKAIQERYKHLKASDPEKQKMNQEIMALYRERGANPASGCLPMLLTMPVLFAFYRLLSLSIEIRGEPFVGWITDLSLADPFYVTPIVMGATMVLQQRMTPTQADPMQQRIMMMMPVMFTFMFVFAPSGLVLYWLTSNVFGIGQQVATNRIIGPPKVRTVRPPAERRPAAERRARKAGQRKGQESAP